MSPAPLACYRSHVARLLSGERVWYNECLYVVDLGAHCYVTVSSWGSSQTMYRSTCTINRDVLAVWDIRMMKS